MEFRIFSIIKTTTIVAVLLFTFRFSVAEPATLELPANLKYGGLYIRFQYPGKAGTFIITNGGSFVTELNTATLFTQTEVLFLPPSETEYKVAIKSNNSNSLNLTKVEISEVSEQWMKSAAYSCLQLDWELATLFNNSQFSAVLEFLDGEHSQSLKDCNLYYLARGEALFAMESFSDAASAYSISLEKLVAQEFLTTSTNGQLLHEYVKTKALIKKGFSEALSGDEKRNGELIRQSWRSISAAEHRVNLRDYTELRPELHNAKATYYRVTNKLVFASRELQAAVEITKKLGRQNETASYLNNIAILQQASGNYSAAQRTFSQSIQLARKNTNHIAEAIQHDNLASNFIELGDFGAAERYYKASIDISTSNKLPEKTADARLGLAALSVAAKRFDNALVHLKMLESIAEKVPARISGRLYALLSEVYAHQKQEDLSEFYQDKATSRLENVGRTRDKLNLLFAAIRSSLQINNLTSSESLLFQANNLIEPSHPRQIEYFQLKNAFLLAQHARNSVDNQDKIKANFEEALQILKQTEETLSAYRLGPSFKSKARKLVNDYLTFLLKSENETSIYEALEIMDEFQSSMMRKSRHFYQQYSHDTLNLSRKNKEYSEAELHLLASESKSSEALSMKKLDEKREQLDAQNKTLMERTSYSSRTKYNSVSQFVLNIPANEAIVRFLDLPNKTIALILTDSEQHVFEVNSNIRKLLSKQNLTKLLNISLENVLPIELLLNANVSKIVLVTDYLTQLIPFSGLKSSSGSYLNDYLQVVRAYSVNDYFEKQQSQSPSQMNYVAVFAGPTFINPDRNLNNPHLPEWKRFIRPLIFAEDELEKIELHFPNNTVFTKTKVEATSDALMSQEMRHARIFHIATHGFYDPQYPGIVGLMTSYKKSEEFTSGFISLTQMLSKPFYSDLVVLSGCDTLRGDIWVSEGQNSLSRGILAQGAGSTLATLWKVSDRATAQFMDHFYRELAQTGNTVTALQSAKQSMIRSGRFRSPKYWAGFVLTVANRKFETIKF